MSFYLQTVDKWFSGPLITRTDICHYTYSYTHKLAKYRFRDVHKKIMIFLKNARCVDLKTKSWHIFTGNRGDAKIKEVEMFLFPIYIKTD